MPVQDFSLKEGEKLTINIKGVTGTTAAPPKKTGGLGGLKKLAPPSKPGNMN